MTKRLELVQPIATSLPDLIGDYLQSCRARGLSPQTIEHDYRFVLERIFLPWCRDNAISAPEQLDQRALDRYGAELHERRSQAGEKLSKWTVRTYVRSVRFFLAWAEREGEPVKGKPQLPKVGKPVREVLTRAEIDAMEQAAKCERDKLSVRLLGDCGLRRNEVTGLRIIDVKRSETAPVCTSEEKVTATVASQFIRHSLGASSGSFRAGRRTCKQTEFSSSRDGQSLAPMSRSATLVSGNSFDGLLGRSGSKSQFIRMCSGIPG